jgi:pyruvate kinase
LAITPELEVARKLSLVLSVHSVHAEDAPKDLPQIIRIACCAAQQEGFSRNLDFVAIAAGVPFGVPELTNLMHIAQVVEEA